MEMEMETELRVLRKGGGRKRKSLVLMSRERSYLDSTGLWMLPVSIQISISN